MRNPHDPIPGFEDEFTGTVGKEKRVHRYMFGMPDKTWKSKPGDKEWYRVGLGRYRLMTFTEAQTAGLIAGGK